MLFIRSFQIWEHWSLSIAFAHFFQNRPDWFGIFNPSSLLPSSFHSVLCSDCPSCILYSPAQPEQYACLSLSYQAQPPGLTSPPWFYLWISECTRFLSWYFPVPLTNYWSELSSSRCFCRSPSSESSDPSLSFRCPAAAVSRFHSKSWPASGRHWGHRNLKVPESRLIY